MYIYLRLKRMKSKQKSKKFKHNSNYFDKMKNPDTQSLDFMDFVYPGSSFYCSCEKHKTVVFMPHFRALMTPHLKSSVVGKQCIRN